MSKNGFARPPRSHWEPKEDTELLHRLDGTGSSSTRHKGSLIALGRSAQGIGLLLRRTKLRDLEVLGGFVAPFLTMTSAVVLLVIQV